MDTPKTSAIHLVAKSTCARRTLRPLDLNNMDALSWFEFMKVMCHVWGISDEVGESKGCGRSVLVSVEFVGLQVGSFTRLRVCQGGLKA